MRSPITKRIRMIVSELTRRLAKAIGWTYECDIRITDAYRQEMRELYDAALTQPYRLYVIRRQDRSRRQLWRMAERIEHRVFWETDRNTRLSLMAAGYRWLNTAAMVVIVDQRPDNEGRPRNFAFGMARVTWGSWRSIPTLRALAKKPWRVSDVPRLLEENGMPRDAGMSTDAMDVTMIAVLKEYRSRGRYFDKGAVMGLLAQVCRFAEDQNIKWWFTILNKNAHRTLRVIMDMRWREFEGISEEWLPYFGSRESRPFWCNLPEWLEWLARERPRQHHNLLREGLENTFAFE